MVHSCVRGLLQIYHSAFRSRQTPCCLLLVRPDTIKTVTSPPDSTPPLSWSRRRCGCSARGQDNTCRNEGKTAPGRLRAWIRPRVPGATCPGNTEKSAPLLCHNGQSLRPP